MERTSFTTNRSWILGILTLVIGLAGFQSASAQCNAPTLSAVSAATTTQSSAVLSWSSNSGAPSDHCWTLTVGGVGMALNADGCPAAGQGLVTATVCAVGNANGALQSNSAAVTGTRTGNNISVTVTGLPAGTQLRWYVSETCDGVGNPVTDCVAGAQFMTRDAQFTVAPTHSQLTCPKASPGYVANGVITVTVTDGSTCAGTYTVTAVPVPNSNLAPIGFAPATPPAVVGPTQVGNVFTFTGAGVGQYTITVLETSGCNPVTNPVVNTLTVVNPPDVVAPVLFLTDLLGNILADTDTGTPAVGSNFNLGNVTLPEGDCGRQDLFMVWGTDTCDGFLAPTGAVTATAATLPTSINPGTVVRPVRPDNFGFYFVDVHWSIGQSTVTIVGVDRSNNPSTLTVTANVLDNTDPIVTILGSSQVTIPVCATTAVVPYTVQVDDLCDQENVNFANLTLTRFSGNAAGIAIGTQFGTSAESAQYNVTFSLPGTYELEARYTDASGNSDIEYLLITVQQAAADQPPVIVANAEDASIPACLAAFPNFRYSFTITDDCQAIVHNNLGVVTGLVVTGMPAGMTPVYSESVNGTNRAVYVEYLGNVAPGTYLPVITYTNSIGQIASVNPGFDVRQDVNQPADIVMPAINVTIPQCATSVPVIAPITITDDCDNPIVAARASFTYQGAAVVPTFVNAAAGYFELTLPLTAAPGNRQLTATYTDAQGLVRTVTALVTVNAQPDVFAPVIVHPSQNIILDLGACETRLDTAVNFSITFHDNCGIATSSVSASGGILTSTGNNYTLRVPTTPGIYTVTATATDVAVPANTTVETFRVIVNRPARPVDNLSCISNVTATLGPDCTFTLSAQNVLSGNFGCLTPADFLITVVDCNPANGGIIDGCGDYIYEVRLRPGLTGFNFTTCWGNVKAEDKTAPVCTPPANTATATISDEVQLITGNLGAPDPTAVWANWACFLEVFNSTSNNLAQHYELHTFTAPTSDIYTFFLSTTFAGGASGMMALFQGPFVPGDPCENMIHQSDNTFTPSVGLFTLIPGNGFTQTFNPNARLSLPLVAGRTYTLLVSSTSNLIATGPYTVAVYSDGAGALTGPTIGAPTAATFGVPLICEDEALVLFTTPFVYITDRNGNPRPAAQQPGGAAAFEANWRKLGITGRPTATDNCGDIRVTVSDVRVAAGNCGLVTITRTFRLEDRVAPPNDGVAPLTCAEVACVGVPNTSSCTQTITIRKPTMPEVILPPFTTFLECDESFPTTANGNPHPSITGYPYLETATGFVNLNQTYCNLAAQYADQPRIVICEGAYKFVRTWTILDWCNPAQSRIWSQIIKVGDYTSPVVTCPVILDAWGVAQNPPTYSTTPFSCTASFAVPMPTVSDVCSQNWTVLSEIVTDVVVPVLNQYGQQVGTTTQTVVVRTILPGANRNVTGIPVGNHRFRYTVTDNCGNVTTIECPFRVLDQIEPNAVCDDQLNISIGGQGFSRVYASDINEGSNDNCGPVTIQVRRAMGCASTNRLGAFTPWGDFVDFSCCDAAGPNSRVLVELRVTDGSGNQNICWLEVLVEDKIRPFCYAPHNTSINCDQLPYDFNPRDTVQLALLFNGTNPPSATDNCTAYVREIFPPAVNLHDCGWGTIVRSFQAVDQAGNFSANVCRQTITINENHNYWIKFPRDYSANCGDPNEGGIEYEEIGCDLLAVSVEDEPFSASGDECYKIFRTYRVINWCEYDGQSAPVIVGRDEDCDNVPGYAVKNLATGQLGTSPRFPNNGIYVIVRGTTGEAKTSWYDSNTNPSDNFPAAFQKLTSCDGLTNPAGHWISSSIDQNATPPRNISSRGFWQYTQHIIVYDNEDPTITVAPFDPFCSYDSPTAADPICEGPVTIKFSVNERCTPDDVTIKVFLDAFRDGTFPFDYNVRLNPNGTTSGDTSVFRINGTYATDYTITAGALPIGRHRFEIHAEDGCGNAYSVLVNFEVRDCKAPTPICYNGLTVTLMPIDTDNDGTPDEGMAEIWASDFIASPVVDCSPPVRYSIRLVGQAPDQSRLGVAFDCSDYNAADGSVGTSHVIFIDAWDAVGNRDFCETYVLVQDQTGICAGPATGSVAGTINTETNEAVEGVDVAVSGPMSQNTLTNVSGSYLLNNLTAGGDYTVTPVLDANYLNGVSTFDLVLISRHILGVQLLNSPYKMVAADVNNSRSITTLDLIQLRRLILAIDTEFANNTSWRFVPASYSFPVPTNPWFEQFPEVININDLAGNMINQNFLAVKIGDVNGSVVPNLTSVEDRTMNGEFALNVMDQQVKAGNEYVVTFTGEQMESIRGYQATLTFGDALELVDVVYGAAKEENFGMRFVGEGAITMSWNGEAKSSDNLFSLVFRANAEGRLSEMLGVSSRYTRTEAYNVNNNLMGVSLNFGGALVSEGFELYQNQPNPFKGQTVIGYNLPEAAYVTLTVQDAAGKVLRVVRNEGVKGYNQVALSSNELPASGVLYYTIATEGFTATKKMIVVQ